MHEKHHDTHSAVQTIPTAKSHEQNAQINAFQKRLPNHFRYFPHSFSNARQTG